jgi:hypothetical protein
VGKGLRGKAQKEEEVEVKSAEKQEEKASDKKEEKAPEKKAEKKEEVKSVDVQEAQSSKEKAPTQPTVRVKPKADIRTFIGDQWYNLKKGKVHTVPKNVKEILARANQLDAL